MRSLPIELREAAKVYGFTPKELAPYDKYIAGHYYWNTYWGKWYEVLDVSYNHEALNYVTVRWSDGGVKTHMTSLDTARDWELIWPEEKRRAGQPTRLLNNRA